MNEEEGREDGSMSRSWWWGEGVGSSDGVYSGRDVGVWVGVGVGVGGGEND